MIEYVTVEDMIGNVFVVTEGLRVAGEAAAVVLPGFRKKFAVEFVVILLPMADALAVVVLPGIEVGMIIVANVELLVKFLLIALLGVVVVESGSRIPVDERAPTDEEAVEMLKYCEITTTFEAEGTSRRKKTGDSL